jgi:hypothetical protein
MIEMQNSNKHYKLFRVSKSFPDGNLIAAYIGNGIGHIDTGATIQSNMNRGPGYLTGAISSTRSAVFTLQDVEILTLPEGDRLLLQAAIGAHELEFIRAFIDFVELRKPATISGDYFEGFDGKRKAYMVDIQMEEGGEKTKYILTNKFPYLEDIKKEIVGLYKDPYGGDRQDKSQEFFNWLHSTIPYQNAQQSQ